MGVLKSLKSRFKHRMNLNTRTSGLHKPDFPLMEPLKLDVAAANSLREFKIADGAELLIGQLNSSLLIIEFRG